jgi:hypothetical protein
MRRVMVPDGRVLTRTIDELVAQGSPLRQLHRIPSVIGWVHSRQIFAGCSTKHPHQALFRTLA